MLTKPDIESAAREALGRVLESDVLPADIGLEQDMAEELGLTSLNKVIFLMSACDGTGVSLSVFTEADVAAMRTLGDVIDSLASGQEKEEA